MPNEKQLHEIAWVAANYQYQLGGVVSTLPVLVAVYQGIKALLQEDKP